MVEQPKAARHMCSNSTFDIFLWGAVKAQASADGLRFCLSKESDKKTLTADACSCESLWRLCISHISSLQLNAAGPM